MKKTIFSKKTKKLLRTTSVVFAIVFSLSSCILGFTGCGEDISENSSKNNSESSLVNEVSNHENSMPKTEISDSSESLEQSNETTSSEIQLESQYSNDVQRTAFEFFKAYVLGDIEKAKGLMDSPDNLDLEQFPDTSDSWCIGSMDKVESYYVELIRCVNNEDTGVTDVTVDIAYSTIADESILYISLDLSSNDIKSGSWKINRFVEEA